MTFTVGVAGITGKFARSVVRNLLEKPDVNIRGYCRDPTKLSASLRSSSRVHVTKGNANDTTALRSFAKGSDVVLCGYLGNDELMVNGQKALIDACEAEGVPRYLASDYSLDYRQLEYGQLSSKDPMKIIEGYLQDKKVQGVHVLIGVFMDTFWSRFFNVWNEKEVKLSFWGTGDEKWESTSYDNAAEFVAEVCTDPKAVGFHEFLGDRQSIREIASSFEKVYGVKPELDRRGSLEELKTFMNETRDRNPADFMKYVPLFYQYYCTNGQTYLKDGLENERYPHIKPVTFERFLSSHKIEDLSGANTTVGADV